VSGDAGPHDPGDPDPAHVAGGMLTWRRLLVETNRRLGDWTEARWLCQEASGLEGTDWVLGGRYRVGDASFDGRFSGIPVDTPGTGGFERVRQVEGTLHEVRMYALFNHASGFFGEKRNHF